MGPPTSTPATLTGPYGTSAREHLIDIQREHAARLQAEIDEHVGPLSTELRAAYFDYQRQFRNPRGPVTRAGFLDALADAQVVYFGDYHTLRESQKAPLRVIAELRARGRRVLLATEVVHFTQQDHVDAYLAGTLDEDEFLARIDYARRWGFPWRNFRLQFEFARAHGLPVWALNSEADGEGDHLDQRAHVAALRIVEAVARDPERLVAVLFGDLHVCPARLPATVERSARKHGLGPVRHRVVFQNAESIYWELARAGLEQTTEVVELEDGNFCLLNSTPLARLQSYLNWEMDTQELEESVGLAGPDLSSSVLTDQVHGLLGTIATFLELEADGLDDFTVYSFRNLEFLDDLHRSGRYRPRELAELRANVERDDSYFLVQDRILYLGNLSVDHAAEEATHYLNTKLAGHVALPPSPRFDFYYRVLKEAIGFLGSRIINHKRPCFTREDFAEIQREFRRRRALTPEQREKRAVAADVIQHLDFEARWLAGAERGYPRFRGLYERPLPVRVGVTHALGYRLGDRLHAALVEGHLHKHELRELFLERFATEPRPRELYFDWLDYLHGHARPRG